MSSTDTLSRRERQIMQFLFRNGPSTAADVQSGIPDAPGYSAVRAHLATLERKGLVKHSAAGPRYVYEPVEPAGRARKAALRNLLDVFFDGSVHDALATMLEVRRNKLSPKEIRDLKALINEARERGS